MLAGSSGLQRRTPGALVAAWLLLILVAPAPSMAQGAADAPSTTTITTPLLCGPPNAADAPLVFDFGGRPYSFRARWSSLEGSSGNGFSSFYVGSRPFNGANGLTQMQGVESSSSGEDMDRGNMQAGSSEIVGMQVCCNSAGYLAGLGINTTDGKFAYMGSRAAGACAAVFNLRRPAANATLVGIKGTYGSDFLGSIQFSWAGVPLPQLPAAANNASSPVPAEQADNNSTSAAAMVTVDSVEIIQGLEGLAVPAPTTATITLIGDAFSVLNAPGGYSSLFGGSRYGAGRVAMVASEQMVTSCCRAAAPETLDTLLYNKILWAARLDVATPNAAKFPNKLRIRVSHPMYSPLAQYVAKMANLAFDDPQPSAGKNANMAKDPVVTPEDFLKPNGEKRVDVWIVDPYNPLYSTPEMRDKMLAWVSNGGGLVVVGPDVTRPVPAAASGGRRLSSADEQGASLGRRSMTRSLQQVQGTAFVYTYPISYVTGLTGLIISSTNTTAGTTTIAAGSSLLTNGDYSAAQYLGWLNTNTPALSTNQQQVVTSVISSTRQSVPFTTGTTTLAGRFWNKVTQIDNIMCTRFGIC